jgi:hypothetical protein
VTELSVGVVTGAAATVNELVFTATSPWTSPVPVPSLLPNHAIFQVYVPAVVGAGAVRVAGKVVELPMPLALPLDMATWAPLWS